jgi:hypothetical protein
MNEKDEKYELLIERIHLLEHRIKELESIIENKVVEEKSLVLNKNCSFLNRLKKGIIHSYKQSPVLFFTLLAGVFTGYIYLFSITNLVLPFLNYRLVTLIYHITLAAFFSFSITLLVLFNLFIIKRRQAITNKEKVAMAAAGAGSVASSFGASFGAPTFGAVCSTAIAPELATLGGSAGSIAASSLGSSNILGSSISSFIIAIAIVISLLSLKSISKKL